MATLSPSGSNPLRGIVNMTLGCGTLTISDVATKWLTASHPTGEVLFFRAVFVLVLIALMVWRNRSFAALRVSSVRDQGVRALLGVGSTFLVVISLSLLPLAEVISLLFVGPLFVTALAMPLLGERVGLRRWLAIVVGFAGVLIMMRPGAGVFQIAALVPIAAAFLGALRDILTRRISATESSTAILAWSTLALVLAGFVTSPFGWRPMDATDLAVAAVAGLLFGLGHYLIIEGYRYAEAAVVSPYRYTNLLWATLLGFLVWGELPDLWLLAGTPLLVGSGLYALLHERAQLRLTPIQPGAQT